MSKASLKAIREYCLNCAGSYGEVETCNPIYEECPLWKYRFGVDPDIAPRNISDETREKRKQIALNMSKGNIILKENSD